MLNVGALEDCPRLLALLGLQRLRRSLPFFALRRSEAVRPKALKQRERGRERGKEKGKEKGKERKREKKKDRERERERKKGERKAVHACTHGCKPKKEQIEERYKIEQR
jgi:hypothetical protein